MSTAHGGPPHDGGPLSSLGVVAVNLGPMAAMRFWQNGAFLFNRGNEVLVRFFRAAMRLQVQLGQELIRSQTSALKQITVREKSEAILTIQVARRTEEAERPFEAAGKISCQMLHIFMKSAAALPKPYVP